MQLLKSKSYDVPSEGHFIANIAAVSYSPEREDLRITYKIVSLKNPTCNYYAGRTYRSADASELQRDLFAIAGEATYDALVDDNDNLIADRLDILLAIKVMIEIEHVHGADHDKPFCKVVSVSKHDPSLN